MVSSGIKAIKLGVQHVRQPCQRVPIGYIGSSKGPNDTLAGQSFVHVMIFDDVLIIVKIDKLEVSHLPVDSECGDKQK